MRDAEYWNLLVGHCCYHYCYYHYDLKCLKSQYSSAKILWELILTVLTLTVNLSI
jgi:hypothetical protein